MAKMVTRTRRHVTLYIVGNISKKPAASMFKVDGISLFLLATLCTSVPSYVAPVFVKLIGNKVGPQWPLGLRRRPAAVRLLRSWVRIPPWAWMFFCCDFCVLSGRGLCDELITCLEESYRLWCVVVCDLDNLVNEEAMTRVGSQRHRKKNKEQNRRAPSRNTSTYMTTRRHNTCRATSSEENLSVL